MNQQIQKICKQLIEVGVAEARLRDFAIECGRAATTASDPLVWCALAYLAHGLADSIHDRPVAATETAHFGKKLEPLITGLAETGEAQPAAVRAFLDANRDLLPRQ